MKTKEVFETLVNEGKSTTEIAKLVGISQTNVRYWLKKFGLKTSSIFYLRNKLKISDERLIDAWNNAYSINNFMHSLGLNSTGGSWYHYRKRLTNLGITPYKGTEGQKLAGLKTAKARNEASLKNRKDRASRASLKKLLDLHKIEYKCSVCSINSWNKKELKLHIHHKNHNKLDNDISNLEYLCPNCHSQEH